MTDRPCFYGSETCEGLTGPVDVMCTDCRREHIERVSERAEHEQDLARYADMHADAFADDYRETT